VAPKTEEEVPLVEEALARLREAFGGEGKCG